MTRPHIMPGLERSDVKTWRPVTKSEPLTLGSGVPLSVQLDRGLGSAVTYPTIGRPSVSSPYPIWRPSRATTRPSRVASDGAATFHRSAARSISINRRVAAARPICGAIVGVVREPNVPWS